VELGAEGDGPEFFLPFGGVEALEQEILYLHEVWGLPYESIMAMPSTRRYRLVAQKGDLEKKRRVAQEAAIARARSRGRRR
jgi:hypothetical protein